MSASAAIADSEIRTPCGIFSSHQEHSNGARPRKRGDDAPDGRRARPSGPQRISKFRITEGFFRSPGLITRANGQHGVRFVSPQVLTAPRVGLTTRLSDFATNRHE